MMHAIAVSSRARRCPWWRLLVAHRRRAARAGARRRRDRPARARRDGDGPRPDDRRASRRRGHAADRVPRARAARGDGLSLAHARRRRARTSSATSWARRSARSAPRSCSRRAGSTAGTSTSRARSTSGSRRSAAETYKHWDHDSLLADVVTVIRAFRPHVIVSVWSGHAGGRPRAPSGGGAALARGFDAAADTVRFPGVAVRRARGRRSSSTGPRAATARRAPSGTNVGEYDPCWAGATPRSRARAGRSTGRRDSAASSMRKGAQMDYVDASGIAGERVHAARRTRNRFSTASTRPSRGSRARCAAGAARRASATRRRRCSIRRGVAVDLRHPGGVVRGCDGWRALTQRGACGADRGACARVFRRVRPGALDLDASLNIVARRTAEAAFAAAGVAVEATAPQELLAFGDSMPVTLTVYNRGHRSP